jgi:Domain of unknown function (DUF4062)
VDKRYTVFVSSTFIDLVDARWVVAKALMRLNLIPLGMESFTASNLSQWEVIKKTIDLSDYYILVLGNRYGTIDSESRISFTEKEYRYALEIGIPCLTFLSKEVPLSPEHVESDEHREKLKVFRETASAGRMVDFWTNPDDLTAKVSTAVVMAQIESPRPGWVRNPKTSVEVAEELARLSRRNSELEYEIEELRKIDDFESPFLFNVLTEEITKGIELTESDHYLKIPLLIVNVGISSLEKVLIRAELEIPGTAFLSGKTMTRIELHPGEEHPVSIVMFSESSLDGLENANAHLKLMITGHNIKSLIVETIQITLPSSFLEDYL